MCENNPAAAGHKKAFLLPVIDLVIFALCCFFVQAVFSFELTVFGVVSHILLALICVFASRILLDAYRKNKSAGKQLLLRLAAAELTGCIVYNVIGQLLLPERIPIPQTLCFFGMELILAIAVRAVSICVSKPKT